MLDAQMKLGTSTPKSGSFGRYALGVFRKADTRAGAYSALDGGTKTGGLVVPDSTSGPNDLHAC